MITDIVLGIQHGDEGKGKVTHHLLKNGDYTHCIRFNGGCNAGHTIFHNDKKFVTHHIPASVFFGIPAIIGPGCVVNIDKFLKELNYLAENGIDITIRSAPPSLVMVLRIEINFTGQVFVPRTYRYWLLLLWICKKNYTVVRNQLF